MSDHWAAAPLAGLGESFHGHGLGLTLAQPDHSLYPAFPSTFSQQQYRSELEQETEQDTEPEPEQEPEPSNTQPDIHRNPADQKHYRQIVQEHQAFKILTTHADEEIEAYLKLSDEELNAIIALRHLVLSTGNYNRHLSQNSIQSSTTQSDISACSSSSHDSRVGSFKSTARSSITSTESCHNYQRSKHTPRSSLCQQSLRDIRQDERQPYSPQYSYWCTVCKKPRRFQTCGGWIKHEKEDHEGTVYVCMPDGPTIHTQHGVTCVLCGSLNPDERHFQTHNIASCMDKALTARTYKRKYQILKHLETHAVSKDHDVASGWRRGCNKKAWACGLCVAYFAKATDRFHHIATQHYERGEGIDKWDTSKVILGLLQQSRVHRAWTECLQSQLPNGEVPDFRWDKTPNGSLVTMLELGLLATDDPQPLAMAAFLQSDYYQDSLKNRSLSADSLDLRVPQEKKNTGIAQDLQRSNDDTNRSEPHLLVRHESAFEPSFESQSFLQLDGPLWSDPMSFDLNDAPSSHMSHPDSSLTYDTASHDRDLTEVEFSNDAEAKQLHDNPSFNIRSPPSSPSKRLISKYANARPVSLMEIDLDLDHSTRSLLHRPNLT